MPGLNYNGKLVAAGAQASTDFAYASANASVQFSGTARFNRGYQAEIGIGAFTDASAAFSKFINASIKGTAFARASAGIQFQFPMNLFKDFGLVAKAQAIAEAAAGVEGGLGISVGDFIRIIERDPLMQGLPMKIMIMLIEEVDVSAKFGINISLSAKAHANFSIAGRVIDVNGQPPGFFYSMGAGVGLLKGVGKYLTAGVQFKNFRRFYGRATDLTIDHTLNSIINSMPSDYKHFTPMLAAFAPVAKIAMRSAFEIGAVVAQTGIKGTSDQTQELCNQSVRIILEETQRFIYHQLVNYACDEIRKIVQDDGMTLGRQVWNSCVGERHELASSLLQMPDEPFQLTKENFLYWEGLISRAISFANKLYNGGQVNPKVKEGISLLFAASELLFEAIGSKVNTVSAYAGVIGTGSVTASTQTFKSPLRKQPDPLIKRTINAKLNRSANSNLTYDVLLSYIIEDAIIDPLIANVPAVATFMGMFRSSFGQIERELLKLFLTNSASFVDTAGGGSQKDAKETLRLIVNSLNGFITQEFREQVLPAILHQIKDPMIRLYMEEVIFGSVIYAKDIGLKTLLNLESQLPDKDDFNEALSGIMMLLLGRSVIVLGDTFLTHLQEIIKDECEKLAKDIENDASRIAPISHLIADPDLKRLIRDCLHVAGEVLGPLPADTRSRVRQLLYRTLEPLPLNSGTGLLDTLADQFFIPNGDQLSQLTSEFTSISRDRFVAFAKQFIGAVSHYILEKLEDVILAAIDLIVHWQANLAESLRQLADWLRALRQHLQQLNLAMIQAMQALENSMNQLFSILGSRQLRTRLKVDIKRTFVRNTYTVLRTNPIYQGLPGFIKKGVEDNVNDVVDGLLNNHVINHIFDAIAAIANELDDLMPDLRQLKPTDNLPPIILEKIVDRIEDKLMAHFGRRNPRINVGLDFSYPKVIFDEKGFRTQIAHIHIALGYIEVPLDAFIGIIRSAIDAVDFYQTMLNNACFKLADFLAKEADYLAAQLDKDKAEADLEKIRRIDEEYNNNPKDIVILSPAPMSHFDNEAEIKIHLGGVAMSNLGLNDSEQQTVFIFLNSKSISPKTLFAKEQLAPARSQSHEKDFDLKGIKGWDPNRNIFKNSRATLVANTAEHKMKVAHAIPARISSKKFYFNDYNYPETNMSLSAFSSHKIMSDGKPASVKLFTGRDVKGGTRITHSIQNQRIGIKMNSVTISQFLEELPAGIFISLKAHAGDLVQGINVLHVVVIDRNLNRHESSVSFSFGIEQTSAVSKGGKPGNHHGLKPDRINGKSDKKGASNIPHLPLPRNRSLLKSMKVVKGKPRKPVSFKVQVTKMVKGKQKTFTKNIKSELPVSSAMIEKNKTSAMIYNDAQTRMNIEKLPKRGSTPLSVRS